MTLNIQKLFKLYGLLSSFVSYIKYTNQIDGERSKFMEEKDPAVLVTIISRQFPLKILCNPASCNTDTVVANSSGGINSIGRDSDEE